MKRYIQLIVPFFFINAAIADVPMVMILDGSQRDAEEVIAVASSSIGNVDNPEQAHKEIFQQEDGKEKVEAYFKYLGDLVRKKKPETKISLKYKAIYDHLDKQSSLAHRHRFHPNYSINEKLKKEFLEKLRQERSKHVQAEYAEIKARNTEYYKDSEAMLLNDKLVEAFRPKVPNIDEIRDSFFIYTCAPYIGRLSRKEISKFEYEESGGIPYKVSGQNLIEKNLLASPDRNSSFKYASYILYSDINPHMTNWEFWDHLMNYHNLVAAYVKYLSVEEVKQFNDKYCVKYAYIANK